MDGTTSQVTFRTATNTTDVPSTTLNGINTIDIVLAVLYSVLIGFGIAGNALVIVVIRKRRTMHTTTNYLLLNVAVCDIVTLLWCPKLYDFAVKPVHPTGQTGDWICRLFTHNAVMGISVLASIFTLTVVSIERYHALVKPMQARLRLTEDSVIYAIGASWLVGFVLSIPNFVFTDFDEALQTCTGPFNFITAGKHLTYAMLIFIIGGLLPLISLIFCYFQIIRGLYFTRTICSERTEWPGSLNSKKSITKLLLSVTISFYVSYFTFGVAVIYLKGKPLEKVILDQNKYSTLLKPFYVFLFLHSALNPVLYVLQSSNFRQGFRNVYCNRSSSVIHVQSTLS